MSKESGLSTNEWAILGALRTAAGHGFAAAQELSATGSIGSVWTVSRPLVYRGIAHLLELGLLTEAGTAPGRAGPLRRLVKLTPRGERTLSEWLTTPVRHIRDYRSELMLKLLFLADDDTATQVLLTAQREGLEPMRSGLERHLGEAAGFDAVLAQWRLSTALAAEQFIDELLGTKATQPR